MGELWFSPAGPAGSVQARAELGLPGGGCWWEPPALCGDREAGAGPDGVWPGGVGVWYPGGADQDVGMEAQVPGLRGGLKVEGD